MKQSDASKLLNGVLKTSGLSYNWKYASGFLFKKTEPLYFTLIVVAHVKEPRLSYTLSYKLLAFDELFWKIVKMEDNAKKPLSFRAAGAWIAPSMEVFSAVTPLDCLSVDSISSLVNATLTNCEESTFALLKEIDDPRANLQTLERLLEKHKERYSNSAVNLWRERMMTLILLGDYENAEAIVLERIGMHDTGGFSIGAQSFYQLAQEYIQTKR